MHKLSQQQLDCIRFYMGDLEIVNQGCFLGGPKAYNTMNALVSKGLHDEVNKIKEGRTIELINVEHVKQYLDMIYEIALAMQVYRTQNVSRSLITYRIDRKSSVEALLQSKELEGFYSTCKYGYLEEYAKIKEDVVLFEIHRDQEVPYLDFEQIFAGYYAKPQEAEILLPFGCVVESMEQVALSEDEKCRYVDMHGKPPVAKWRLQIRKPEYKVCTEDLYSMLVDEKTVLRVQSCLQVLMKKDTLSKEDETFYLAWKEKVSRYLCGKLGNGYDKV